VAQAVRAADPATLARAVADGGTHPLEVPGVVTGTVDITAQDVIVTQAPLAGWEVASADGETVALDLTVTPALRAEGLAREVVRRIQEARKAAGLAVTDRIAIRWATVPAAPGAAAELGAALAEHGAMIADEVLAVEFEPGAGPGPGHWLEHLDANLGLRFWLTAATG
jgi:isoleucyl-tRNA synthetase